LKLVVVLSVIAFTFYLLKQWIGGLALEGMKKYTVNNVFGNLFTLSLMAAGLTAIIYAYHKNIIKKALDLFAPCGRMSLTIYVMQ